MSATDTTATARETSSRFSPTRTAPRAHDVLNIQLLRARRRELHLSRADTARASGLALSALERLEDGDTTADLTLSQLHRLADVLGVTMRSLLTAGGQAGPQHQPGTLAEGDASQVVDQDVAQLACLLLVSGATISRDLAAHALGWELPRVVTTLVRLETEGPSLGVQLIRRGFTVRLARTGDWNRRVKLATWARRDHVTRSTKARTARLAHALLTGDADADTAQPDVVAEARTGGVVDVTGGLTDRVRHATLAKPGG